jgi:alkylation response protein AidB-like acyl-CoA dehydrogenase
VLEGNQYVANGQKVWISRAQQSDLMLLLARTTPADQVKRRSDGISVFLVDLREAVGNGIEIRKLDAAINHSTNEIFIDNLKLPPENLIGEEGKGFRYILDGMNAERILIAHESLGDAKYFIRRATEYANERVVFGHPIGKNQGVQFPIARAYAELQAAELLVHKAAALFDARNADLRRLRLRPRIRHRAQMARMPPLSNRPDLDQHDPGLYRPARPRLAALLLRDPP